ncbi:MAG TPA: endo-1,4-beta-xylanase, partial [Aggregatilineales bacterium]|nr:endo-1,4-beta-xylanase [Aggregatilineales bacterium]
MSLRHLLLVAIAALVAVTQFGAAGDSDLTLRDLADVNDFYVGAAVYTYHLDNAVHADTLSREFNMITPEQEAKFCEIQRQRGEFDFSRVDELVEFAEEHDMAIHGHALLWHQCSPQWVESGDFSREEAIEILREHITTVVGRYKGRIAIWDVVNEAIDNT